LHEIRFAGAVNPEPQTPTKLMIQHPVNDPGPLSVAVAELRQKAHPAKAITADTDDNTLDLDIRTLLLNK
jgi:hypothetical protein